jgi:death on curing protein
MTRYLTIHELIYINGSLLKRPDIASGKTHVRDLEMLDAAAERPMQSAFGQDAYPTLNHKVAALMHSISRNHPFTDGNKRTATVAGLMMFCVNGQRVVWNPEEALEQIVALADGRCKLDDIAAWFPLQDDVEYPEPDIDTDKRLIAEIIEEQWWLLNALEKR